MAIVLKTGWKRVGRKKTDQRKCFWTRMSIVISLLDRTLHVLTQLFKGTNCGFVGVDDCPGVTRIGSEIWPILLIALKRLYPTESEQYAMCGKNTIPCLWVWILCVSWGVCVLRVCAYACVTVACMCVWLFTEILPTQVELSWGCTNTESIFPIFTKAQASD